MLPCGANVIQTKLRNRTLRLQSRVATHAGTPFSHLLPHRKQGRHVAFVKRRLRTLRLANPVFGHVRDVGCRHAPRGILHVYSSRGSQFCVQSLLQFCYRLIRFAFQERLRLDMSLRWGPRWRPARILPTGFTPSKSLATTSCPISATEVVFSTSELKKFLPLSIS